MKNITKLFIALMGALFLLGACSNDSSENEEGTTENQSEETDDSTTDQTDDTTDETDESNEEVSDTSDEPDDSSDENADASGEILSLGETGTIEDTLGTYEVTPTSVEFLESAEGTNPYNGVFVVIDVSIENTGDAEINSSDIAKASLFNSDDIKMDSQNHYEFVDNFTDPIAPGETATGQLLIDHNQSDSYQLVFGYGLETVSNEIRWEFSADEAE